MFPLNSTKGAAAAAVTVDEGGESVGLKAGSRKDARGSSKREACVPFSKLYSSPCRILFHPFWSCHLLGGLAGRIEELGGEEEGGGRAELT